MLTRSGAGEILTPEQVHSLVVEPTMAETTAASVATVVNTAASSFRVPTVLSDPTASWVDEGEEIPASEMDFGEATAEFAKLAGLTIITAELAADSSPEAAEAVGAGLARDLARKVDEAFYGNLAAPAPSGLASLTGVTETTVSSAIKNTDPFVRAIAAAQGVNASVDTFVANPADALELALVKKGTGSNEHLLQPDPTAPAQRTVAGVPLLTSPSVTQGTIWGVPRALSYLVVREDAEVEQDTSVYFTSDRVAVRGKLRVGFAFPHAAAVQKITVSAA